MQIGQMETDRLIIRSTTESDGNNCLDIWLDDEMGKYLCDPPRSLADDATLNFAVNIEQNEDWYPMVVIHKETNEFLGTCSIVPSKDGNTWDLGYAIHKKFWRQGYATEFLSKLIEIGRQKGISTFTAVPAKENVASCKLLEKLGFKIIKDNETFNKRGTDIFYEEYTFELKYKSTKLCGYNREHEKELITMIIDFWAGHNAMSNSDDARKDINNWSTKGHSLFLIHHDNEIAGFLHLGERGGGKADWLEDIYVKHEYRRKGIATEAIKQAEKYVKENGSVSMYVEVVPSNAEAVRLYHKLGFNQLSLITISKDFEKKEGLSKESICNLQFEVASPNNK